MKDRRSLKRIFNILLGNKVMDEGSNTFSNQLIQRSLQFAILHNYKCKGPFKYYVSKIVGEWVKTWKHQLIKVRKSQKQFFLPTIVEYIKKKNLMNSEIWDEATFTHCHCHCWKQIFLGGFQKIGINGDFSWSKFREICKYYRVFKLDMPQKKHLLGHQKSTFKW